MWSIKNMFVLDESFHCIVNMKRIKFLTLLMLCIVAMWVFRTHIEWTNVPFLSHADETLEIINIKIDISWNSTSVNSSAEASINSAKTPFSIDLNVIPERTTAAVVSSESGEPTSAFTQSSDLRPSIETQIDSFMPTSSSWPDYRGLTDSASTASQSTSLQQSNNSLWASDNLRSTAQVSSSSFSEKTSIKKISKKEIDLLIILDCVTEMLL